MNAVLKSKEREDAADLMVAAVKRNNFNLLPRLSELPVLLDELQYVDIVSMENYKDFFPNAATQDWFLEMLRDIFSVEEERMKQEETDRLFFLKTSLVKMTSRAVRPAVAMVVDEDDEFADLPVIGSSAMRGTLLF